MKYLPIFLTISAMGTFFAHAQTGDFDASLVASEPLTASKTSGDRVSGLERSGHNFRAETEGPIDASPLADALEQKRTALKNFIESIADNQDILDMQQTLAQIQDLERENGIAALQAKVARLRIQACYMQQQEPIKGYLKQIRALTKKIEKLTQAERTAIDALMQEDKQSPQQTTGHRQSPGQSQPRTTSLRGLPRGKEAQGPRDERDRERIGKIKELEAAMRNKAADELQAIDELNEKIYKIMARQINAAKPLAGALETKYKNLHETLKPLDEKLSKAINAINIRLKTQADAVMKLKKEIYVARDIILKRDPCLAARESMREATWEAFFV